MRCVSGTLSVLLIAVWAMPLLGDDGARSWKSLGLLGHVRTLTESDVSDVTAANPDGTPFHTITTLFSPDGNAASVEDCVSTCEHTSLVWQDGLLIEEEHKSKDKQLDYTIYYIWNADGRIGVERTVWDAGLECAKLYRRDASQEQEVESCGGVPIIRRVRKNGELPNSQHASWYTYNDEDEGEVLETQYEESKTRMDDDATRTEQVFDDGSVASTTYADGRLLEEVRNFPTAYHRETHRYDQKGCEIEKAEWQHDGTIINRRTYEYLSDPQGNWIRRTESVWSPAYSAPVPGQVTIRRIDYY